jgi:hypothetical protein
MFETEKVKNFGTLLVRMWCHAGSVHKFYRPCRGFIMLAKDPGVPLRYTPANFGQALRADELRSRSAKHSFRKLLLKQPVRLQSVHKGGKSSKVPIRMPGLPASIVRRTV